MARRPRQGCARAAHVWADGDEPWIKRHHFQGHVEGATVSVRWKVTAHLGGGGSGKPDG